MASNVAQKSIYCFAPGEGWNDQQMVKNCGALPMVFYRKYGFRAILVGGRLCQTYPSFQKYLTGVEMDFYRDTQFSTKLEYVQTHAYEMDVMVLHGFSQEFWPMADCYKKLNPSGKIYLELDINKFSQDRLDWASPEFRCFLSQCDVIGASCRRMQQFLNRKWPSRIFYLPNGFYNFDKLDLTVDFAKKENIILTVGRIGTHQKNNEMLLDAFARIYKQLPTWRLQLTGNVKPAFKQYLDNLCQCNPGLEQQVMLTGAIFDKVQLFNQYKKAKVFALTSRLEGGAPNVVAEAMYGGCYMVATDVDASADIVAGGKCGKVVQLEDPVGLADTLVKVCQDDNMVTLGGKYAQMYGQKTMDFERIMSRLHYLLFGIGENHESD